VRVISENYVTSDFKSLLGVNVFDGVVWFNKERFEEAVEYAPLFASLVIGADTAIDAQKRLLDAEAKSDYRMDALLEALE
jgi:hypothetical protein